MSNIKGHNKLNNQAKSDIYAVEGPNRGDHSFAVIIGIALVVEELHKGPRLAFRYPPSVPSNILNDNEELVQFHEEYLSTSPEHFAKLFRPKAALCSKSLELDIHNLHHICYPCSLVDSIGELDSDREEEHQSTPLSLFNVIVSSVRNTVLEQMNYKGQYTANMTSGYIIEDPISVSLGLGYHHVSEHAIKRTVELLACAMLAEEKRCLYVRDQVSLMMKITESNTAPGSVEQGINTISPQKTDSESSMTPQAEGHDIISCAEKELMATDEIMEKLSLPNEFRMVYHGLIGGHSINFRVNNSVPIYYLLSSPSLLQHHVDADSSLLFVADSDAILSLVTRLDLPDEENIGAIASPSGTINPRHHNFILQCSPLISLQDLSLNLDESIDEVIKLSNYFVRLGLARYIPPIHHETIFKVCLSTPTDKSHKVYTAFANCFSNETIAQEQVSSDMNIQAKISSCQNLLFMVLAAFDGSVFIEVVKKFPASLVSFGVDIILWLLRWRLIEHSNTIQISLPSIIQ